MLGEAPAPGQPWSRRREAHAARTGRPAAGRGPDGRGRRRRRRAGDEIEGVPVKRSFGIGGDVRRARETAQQHQRRPENLHSGIFPCFLGGFLSRLFSSAASAVINLSRVSLGSITASMKPRFAAMYGFANLSRYSINHLHSKLFRIGSFCKLTSIHDVDCALRTHYCNFR